MVCTMEPKRGEAQLHEVAARERLHVLRVAGVSAHHAVSTEILGQIQQREETGS